MDDDRGAIDEPVDAAEPRLGGGDGLADRGGIGGVERDAEGVGIVDRRHGLLQRVRAEVGERDMRALGDEQFGGRRADPARPPVTMKPLPA